MKSMLVLAGIEVVDVSRHIREIVGVSRREGRAGIARWERGMGRVGDGRGGFEGEMPDDSEATHGRS